MDGFPAYEVAMEEIHHIHKLDAPSGTALSLAEDIKDCIGRLSDKALPIESKRIGEAPGTHEVCYESAVDRISIRHEAKNRKGFALGAVLAAEFICGKTGFFTMNDLLQLK
jgi:4-hydroxy-tetrahydrodipicolinate reductase